MLQPDPAAFVQILVVVAVPIQDDAVLLPHVEPVKLPVCLRIPLAFGLARQFVPRLEMAKSEVANSEVESSLQLLDGPVDQEGHRLDPKGLEAPKTWRRYLRFFITESLHT